MLQEVAVGGKGEFSFDSARKNSKVSWHVTLSRIDSIVLI